MQCNVLDYLEETAAIHGKKEAVVDANGSATFNELERISKKVAIDLMELGVGTQQPIAILLPTRTVKSLVAFLATLYSGNAYVPLDIKNPVVRLRSILTNLDPALVICEPGTEALLHEIAAPNCRIYVLDDVPEANELDDADDQALQLRRNQIVDVDPAYIIYTSGSTGAPKGVAIPHRGIIDYIDWAKECFVVDETAVIGSQAPFYFDNSTLDIYLTLATGARLVLIPDDRFMFPVRLMEYLAEYSVNFIFWVPSVLINVANLNALDTAVDLKLEKILFAGEVMPTKHLNYWIDHFPHAVFANLYGPTEITVDCTYYIVDRPFANDEALPIGKPCRNTDVFILDNDQLVSAPGHKGELCVRGSSLALGYWNNPEKTAAVFTQNPLNNRYPERIYRTGDLVHMNDAGEIMFDGRLDFQIKHMGHRIELGEIEIAALSLPEIDAACVIYEQERSRVTLVYEATEEVALGVLRKRLSALLPAYMLPGNSVHMASLPKNQNGKFDRIEVSRLIAQ